MQSLILMAIILKMKAWAGNKCSTQSHNSLIGISEQAKEVALGPHFQDKV